MAFSYICAGVLSLVFLCLNLFRNLMFSISISGDMFNKFANWTEWDNNTGIVYETWTVRNEPGIYC